MIFYEYGDPSAELTLVQMVDGHDLEFIESEAAAIRKDAKEPFSLIACRVKDWNKDLSPWKAPAVFGREDFGDGAAATLAQVLNQCADPGRRYIIGGYSLAGLFALWAAYQTGVFVAVAAASPSIWFPGFIDYMKEREINAEAVYLSLGDREEKTRNPLMATVGERIREAYDLLSNSINCVLEWNQGNHFKDADLRTARAFIWAMEHASGSKML